MQPTIPTRPGASELGGTDTPGFPIGAEAILALAERAAGIGVWHVDIATLTLRGTPQFFRMLGLPPAAGPGPLAAVTRLRHPDDAERVRAAYRGAIDSGADRCEVEFRIIRPDGELRWILGRGQVERDAGGRAVSYTGVNLDITDSMRSEAALR